MGLDLALGILVVMAGLRGWMKGFLAQVIRLVSVVVAVYLAVPVRDQVKPYALEYLPTVPREKTDQMLWWGAAVVTYLVLVAVASLGVAVSRRRTFGIEEPRRGDQFAGFGLGLIKGLVVAAFLVSSLERYAPLMFENFSWAKEQANESQAWAWNTKFHPGARIWAAPPVQSFVAHIKKNGWMGPAATTTEGEKEAAPQENPLQTASRIPQLMLPPGLEGLDANFDTSDLDPELAAAVEQLKKELTKLEASP